MGAHSRDRDDMPRTAEVVHIFKPGPKPDNRAIREESADGVTNWETTRKTYPIHGEKDGRITI